MKRNAFFPNPINLAAAVLTFVGIYIAGKAAFCVGAIAPDKIRASEVVEYPLRCFGNILYQNMWIYLVAVVLIYLLASVVLMVVRNNKNRTIAKSVK